MASKNIISVLILLFTFGNLSAQNPETLSFAGKIIRLDSAGQVAVNQEIDRLRAERSDYFMLKQRCAVYFPVLEDELMKNGLHPDYKFLAASLTACTAGFSENSEAGIWRISSEKARESGLFVGPEEDDRRHILASTKMAAQYFALAERQFSLPTAVMAAFYENFQTAGRIESGAEPPADYLIRTLALKKAFSEEQLPENQLRLLAFPAPGNKNLAKIAKQTQTDPILVSNYNPYMLAGGKNVPAGKTVFLPVDANSVRQVAESNGITGFFPYESLNAEIAEPAETGTKNGLRIVYARPGDSPALLAEAGGISAENFRVFNDLADFERLKNVNFYYLESKKKQASAAVYTLKKDESFWDAAHENGILLSALLAYNKLKINSPASEGMVLRLQPEAGEQTGVFEIPDNSGQTPRLDLAFQKYMATDSLTVTYKVRSGEKLEDIARKFQVPGRHIALSNRLIGNGLTVGEVLKFKVRKINSEENELLKAGRETEKFRIETYSLLRYESIHQIADKLDISADILANNNGGKDIDQQLPPGIRLIVRQPVKSYRASFGESIETIAKQLDVSPDLLAKVTGKPRSYGVNLLGERLYFQGLETESEVLRMPAPSQEEFSEKVEVPASSERKFHTLNYGENPYGIARKYNMNAGYLLQINNLTLETATNLKPGDRLYLEPEK